MSSGRASPAGEAGVTEWAIVMAKSQAHKRLGNRPW